MTALLDLSSVKDVLVVDDDPVMLDVAEVMLERLGVKGIHTVLDGHAGLERLAELGESCNLSICDLDMPGIDGIEFMRRVVDLGWHGGMIFVSGTDKRLLDVVKAIGRARAIGGLETLTKPLDPEKLAAAARRVTSRPMQRRTAGDDPMVTPADLEAALSNGELVLEYQPKIEVASERVVGCEALVRWSHPSMGRIGPNVFIPLAEQCGLIGRVTEYVVQQAMSDVADWSAWTSLNLAINVSMQDLQDLSWPDWLTDVAERHGVSTGQVTLEVTESSAIANLANSLEILARCRLRGFGLSIDDFGTGFSSLEKLSYVPFTELKIDRRFVQDSGVSSRAILQASIELARELAMTTVAEGVETDEQLELVRGLGCNLVQGFLFARPMCAADFSSWYSARQDDTPWQPVIDQPGARGDVSW